MVALDTDVLSEILRGNHAIAERASRIPASQRVTTVVTVEELLRGRLDRVREAQSRRDPAALVQAYHRLVETVVRVSRVRILHDSEAAEAQFDAWRAARTEVGSNDLRIAAIAHTAGATLVTCNRRHFSLVPGLDVEFWPQQ